MTLSFPRTNSSRAVDRNLPIAGQVPMAIERRMGMAIGRRKLVGFVGFVLLASALGASVEADNGRRSLTFRIQKLVDEPVCLAFFSKNREKRWPAADESYLLEDSEVHEFNLDCALSEEVGYGAWLPHDPTSAWGLGADNGPRRVGSCFEARGQRTPIIQLIRSPISELPPASPAQRN